MHREVFKISQKVAQYLGKFCKRIRLQDFPNVAQSGHTESLPKQEGD